MYGHTLGVLSLSFNDEEVWATPTGFSSYNWHSIYVEVKMVHDNNLFFKLKSGKEKIGTVGIDEIYVQSISCKNVERISDGKVKKIREQRGIERSVHVSSSQGNDTEDCGDIISMCQTIEFGLALTSSTKRIILHHDSEYGFQCETTNKTRFLTFQKANEINNIILYVNGSCILPGLAFQNLSITGNIDVYSDSESYLELEYIKVAAYDHYFFNSRSDEITIHFSNSSFLRSGFELFSKLVTKALISDCTFIGGGGGGLVVGEGGNSRTIDTGVVFENRDEGNHAIVVEGCRFQQHMQTTFQDMRTSAALGIINRHKDSKIKIVVAKTSFVNNGRGMDLSLIGESEVILDDCLFKENKAEGSGGAFRATMTKKPGFASLGIMKKAYISIYNSKFYNNSASTTDIYETRNVYFQTRSIGNGGAIYVNLKLPSVYNKVGLVNISGCLFKANLSSMRGGVIFINSGVSLNLEHSEFTSIEMPGNHSKIGDMLYSSGNTTISHIKVRIYEAKTSTALIAYQAAAPSEHRLLVINSSLECPLTFSVQLINSTAYGSTDALETMNVYCRACEQDYYTLETSKVDINLLHSRMSGAEICEQCPYGAICNKGIVNNAGFWRAAYSSHEVEMHICPPDYCTTSKEARVAYGVCEDHRVGTLCGHCKEGYSEMLQSTVCVDNQECGLAKHWKAAMLMLVFGVIYVLFFMFEPDYEGIIDSITSKFQRDDVNGENSSKSNKVVISETGYLQIFMYYVQTSELLKLDIVVESQDKYAHIIRPDDVIPDKLSNLTESIFEFNILSLGTDKCFISDVRPVEKIAINSIFILYYFAILLVMYVFTGFCCRCTSELRRPKIGSMGLNSRMVMTFLLLLLYTYQELAENALQLLNCVTLNGESVLFLDGSQQCLQVWQYAIMAVVSIFIFPFFVVLLFGPRVLQSGRISVFVLTIAFLFPLIFSVPIVYLFVDEYRKKMSEIKASREEEEKRRGREITSRIRMELQAEEEDRLALESDKSEKYDEVRDLVCSVVFGPYATVSESNEGKQGKSEAYMYGLCWEGVINFRRLVQVLIATFINDILTKHITLTFACFLFLLIHLRARPFKYHLSNTIEAISLSLLLNLAIANLVKAGFYSSQTVPRDSGYMVIVALEWMETVILVLLPIGICLTLLVSIVLKRGKCFGNFNPFRCKKSSSSISDQQSSKDKLNPQVTYPRNIRQNTLFSDNPSNKLYSNFNRQFSAPTFITRPYTNDGGDMINDPNPLAETNQIIKRNVIFPKVKQIRNIRLSQINRR